METTRTTTHTEACLADGGAEYEFYPDCDACGEEATAQMAAEIRAETACERYFEDQGRCDCGGRMAADGFGCLCGGS